MLTTTDMMPARVLGHSATAFRCSAVLCYVPRWLLALLRGPRLARSVTNVRANYDAERLRMLAEIDDYPDLESFCLYREKQTDFHVFAGHLRHGEMSSAAAAVYGHLKSAVSQKISGLAAPTILEFGSGFGRNCLLLKRDFPHAKIIGLELSPISVEVSQAAARRFGMAVDFRVADVTSLDERTCPTADLVFSCHALEQMPRIFPKAVKAMFRTKSRWIILVEPVVEHLSGFDGWLARMRTKVHDRLIGLPEELRKQSLLIIEERLLDSSINPLNRSSLIVCSDQDRVAETGKGNLH